MKQKIGKCLWILYLLEFVKSKNDEFFKTNGNQSSSEFLRPMTHAPFETHCNKQKNKIFAMFPNKIFVFLVLKIQNRWTLSLVKVNLMLLNVFEFLEHVKISNIINFRCCRMCHRHFFNGFCFATFYATTFFRFIKFVIWKFYSIYLFNCK